MIAMTGATGYLGSHLARALRERGRKLLLVKRSTSNTERIRDILPECASVDVDHSRAGDALRDFDVEGIIHLATNYGRSGAGPAQLVEDNVVFPLGLAAGARNLSFFINAGTSLAPAVSPYALSKEQFRQWLERRAEGLAVVQVTLEHFYGPGDDPSKFVTAVLQRLLRGEERIALTAGTQRRDFLHIDDTVAAFLALLEGVDLARPGYQSFAVGSGSAVPVRELVETMARVAGNTESLLDFGAVPFRSNEALFSEADLTAIKQIGWSPRLSLEEGLAQMADAERQLLESRPDDGGSHSS